MSIWSSMAEKDMKMTGKYIVRDFTPHAFIAMISDSTDNLSRTIKIVKRSPIGSTKDDKGTIASRSTSISLMLRALPKVIH
jgi:hypothetical protein